MPSILQLQPMAYLDIAETMFLGGSTLVPVSDTEFRTQSGDVTIVFTGSGLSFGAGGLPVAGELEEYRVYVGGVAIANQQVIVSSNFTLLTADEMAAAFGLAAAGDLSGAVALVTASWTAEYFSHTNYSGGPLFGYGGGDGLSGGLADDVIFGRGGDDGIVLNGGNDVGFGEAGNDRLYGYDGQDVLYGGTGNDILYGGADADRLFGGAGQDALHGGRHGDVLDGGAGDDYLGGDQASDRLNGGAGNDLLEGDGGDDTLSGGSGDDTLRGGGGDDHALGGTGDDSLAGGGGDDTLAGGAGADEILGQSGFDVLYGYGGHDTLIGGGGNDTIGGGLGQNRLRGQSGEDRLVARGSDDTLVGGRDADTFVIRVAPGGTHRITDFENDIDMLDLTAFGFADAPAVVTAATDTVDGHVLFDLGGGQTLLVRNATTAELLDDLLF